MLDGRHPITCSERKELLAMNLEQQEVWLEHHLRHGGFLGEFVTVDGHLVAYGLNDFDHMLVRLLVFIATEKPPVVSGWQG